MKRIRAISICLSMLMILSCIAPISYAADGVVADATQPETDTIEAETDAIQPETDTIEAEAIAAAAGPETPVLNGWQNITNSNGVVERFYYVDGVPVTGFYSVGQYRYYFNSNGVMQTGWQTVNGYRYYLNSKGVVQKGLKTIGKYKYYFNSNGVMQTGWQTVNGYRYYLNSKGVVQKGLKTIGKYKYYFNSNGVMQKGLVKTGGYLYYFTARSGRAKTTKGFFKGADGKVRYALGNGRVARGIKTINGKGYVFYRKTGVKRMATGWYDIDGKHVYIRDGRLVTGWDVCKSGAFYCYQTGENKYDQAKDTTIKYLRIPKSGFLGEAYVLGIERLNKSGWTLENAYRNSYRLKYAHRWMRKSSAEAYAVYAFRNNMGNCYCMASTFYIQAKLLGYNVRQIEGKVNYRFPHSWTQIKQDGRWWVYDPNFRNETGGNGWKIYYGKRGTWRYMNYHVFQN